MAGAACLGAVAAACTLLTSCGGDAETAAQQASPGDVLVRTTSGEEVRLVTPFRAGVPNGLYGGVVEVSRGNGGNPGRRERFSVNAVCSLEGVPGWPAYDNVYGEVHRKGQQQATPTDSKAAAGNDTQHWQVLLHFDGRIEQKSASDAIISPLQWAPRLRDNLCRKGDFDDRPTARS